MMKIKEIVLMVLLLFCTYSLVNTINSIYSFSADERDYDVNKYSLTTIDNIELIDDGTYITRTEITNLAIMIINANILILCIYIILNDFYLMMKESNTRLRDLIKND